MVSNVTAEPVRDADSARSTLLSQLTAPVRWTQSVRRMASAGVSRFLEFGPGTVLTGLLRRIDSGLEGMEIGEPDDLQRLREGVS